MAHDNLSVPLKPATLAPMAQLLAASGEHEKFVELLKKSKKDLSIIDPAIVAKVVENCDGNTLIELMHAVRNEESLLAVITPDKIELHEGRVSPHHYTLLARGVAGRDDLRAVLNPKNFAENARILVDGKIHRTGQGADAFKSFQCLVKVAAADPRLQDAITPLMIKKAVTEFYKADYHHAQQFHTDENYPTEVKGGLPYLGSFMKAMKDAPEPWQKAMSRQICELLENGKHMDDRITRLVGEAVNEMPYALQAADFKTMMESFLEKDTHYRGMDIVENLLGVRHLEQELSEAVHALTLREWHDRNNLVSMSDEDFYPMNTAAISEIFEELHTAGNHMELAHFMRRVNWQYWKPLKAELAKKGLHVVECDLDHVTNRYGKELAGELRALTKGLPRMNSDSRGFSQFYQLDLVFSKVAGGKVSVFMGADLDKAFPGHSQIKGVHQPKHTAEGITSFKELKGVFPKKSLPAIRFIFEKVATVPFGDNSDTKLAPKWVRDIAGRAIGLD